MPKLYAPPPLPPWLLKSARTLRSNLTDAEAFLWLLLRRKQLGGFRFRHQHPVHTFILDFYCCEAKVAVELDGGQHNERARQDAERTAILEAHGIKVLRFWDNEVFQNVEGVLEAIYLALVERSERLPPP